MSSSKGNDRSEAANSASDGSPSYVPLFVPPPEQPWMGAGLALALHTDAAQSRPQCRNSCDPAGGVATATTATPTAGIFTFPFTLPGGASMTQLPSLSTLLPPPMETQLSKERQQQQCKEEDNDAPLFSVEKTTMSHSDTDASHTPEMHTRATTATTEEVVVLLPSLPFEMVSRASFSTISLSGVTQVGITPADVAAAADSQGHSVFSVSSDTTSSSPTGTQDAEPSPQTSRVAAFGESRGGPPSGGSSKSNMHHLHRNSQHRNSHNTSNTSVPRSPLQASTTPTSSFTDLFVGLERPRLHRLPRQSDDSLGSRRVAGSVGQESGSRTNNTNGNASIPSSAIHSVTSNLFSFVQADPSMEASMREEVAEDDEGAHTPTVYRSSQLPHWWRSIVTPSVGTQVCLRPNTPRLEFWWIDRLGSEAYELIQVILRHSLEGIVLRQDGESVVVVEFRIPGELLDNTSFAVCHPYEQSTYAQPTTTADAAGNSHGSRWTSPAPASTDTWKLETVDDDDDDDEAETTLEGTAKTDTPPPLDLSDNPTHCTQSPFTTDTPVSSDLPRRPEHEVSPEELPELVRPDSIHHDTVEHDSSNFTTTTATGAARAEETLVRDLQRHCSSSVGGSGGYSSLSAVEQSRSLLTAGGGYSDPFMAERRFLQEPPLTRILATSPKSKNTQAPNASSSSAPPPPTDDAAKHEDNNAGAAGATQLRRFPTGNLPLAELPAKGGANALLRSPVTPGERGYSPDTSMADSHDSAAREDTDRSVTSLLAGPPQLKRKHTGLPLYELPTTVSVGPSRMGQIEREETPSSQQQQQQHKPAHPRAASTGRTSSANSGDNRKGDNTPRVSATYGEDPSLLRVDSLPKSEDTSIVLNSTESPHQQTSSYFDPFPRSKTYGEWLRSSATPLHYSSSSPYGSSQAGGRREVIMNVGSGLVAAAPPWSDDDPNETTNFLGRTTSVSEMDGDEIRHDDSFLVRLSLPSSVCIPVVAARLHALQLLHPLLRALTIPFSLSSFTPEVADDDDDEDGMEEALRAAARVSPFTSELVGHAATSDYHTAVHVLSDAISCEEERRLTTMTERDPARLPMRPRDLSILYTIRSHLYFHMAPEYLNNSLKDAERALSCCPTQEHVCNTYEVLMACLISVGHTAQVERVTAHLRHRCRTPTPLLTRLDRVTQVMVSYGTLFLHQQLKPTLLRRPRGDGCGIAADRAKAQQSYTFVEGVQAALLDSRAYLNRGTSSSVTGTAAVSNSSNNTSSGVGAATMRVSPSPLVSSPTTMPLVVVGGGIVDPPKDWGRLSPSSSRHHVDGVTVAGQSTVPTIRTLPYEVCPLLLGYYGKSLHRPNDIVGHPYPPPLSPSARDRSFSPGGNGDGAGGKAARGSGAVVAVVTKGNGGGNAAQRRHHARHMARPSNDVCHRRLFLLETLFPSVLPVTTASRLRQVAPIPRPSVCRRSSASCGRHHRHVRRSPTRARDVSGEDVPAAAKGEKLIKPEDFMYDRDSMFALLATATETAIPYGTVSMRYFGRHIRLSATRRIPKDETILLEKPALMLALWPLPRPRRSRRAGGGELKGEGVDEDGSNSGSGAAVAVTASAQGGIPGLPRKEAPTFCAQCGRQRLTHLVQCPGRCGTTYCSDACRREALRLYHVVECGGVPADATQGDSDGDGGSDVRVRRAVAALQDIFAEWDAFLYHFANWDTPKTRPTAPVASCSPPVSVFSSPQESGLHALLTNDAQPPSPQQQWQRQSSDTTPAAEQRIPPPILAVTGMRAMSRLVAMMLCMVLPVESLPQLRDGNADFIDAWAGERHAKVRAAARTLRYRGLMVPASTRGTLTNVYCSGVDPHRLLLLEVMLQQVSIPFFADFTYLAPSTVWEAMGEFACAVPRKATPNGRNNCARSSGDGGAGGTSINAGFDSGSPCAARSSLFPFSSHSTSKPPPASGPRRWFVELNITQREELMCTAHRMLQRMHDVVRTELENIFVLPLHAPPQKGDNDVTAGAPLHWTCPELLGFLPSTRVYEELQDFCMTSCAVVYPQDVEPEVGDGVSSSSSGSSEAPRAVPLAVISPWTCLTIDLHPLLGHGSAGVIYSRFMVEHEQRRRMIAYCAAATTRRGAGAGGGGNLGSGYGSGYGSGLEDDSFLSVHSVVSASAAVLGGSAMSPGMDDLARSNSFRDDLNLQMLEDAANRSCANLRLALFHSLSPSDTTRPPTVAVVMTAKKNIQLGDVLWWEALNFGEYLYPIF